MKIGIIGVTGRMGNSVQTLLSKCNNIQVSGGVSSKSSIEDMEHLFNSSDVLIDFSTIKSSLTSASLAKKFQKPLVIGTTGFSDLDYDLLKKYSDFTPILHSDNFSICVQLMTLFAQKTSKVLSNFDITIIEGHRKLKKDRPSGTAKYIANSLFKKSDILSIRAGNLSGEHEIRFISENEEFSLFHQAFDRSAFASGAIKCAKWLVGKEPKFYSILDYLNEEKIF